MDFYEGTVAKLRSSDIWWVERENSHRAGEPQEARSCGQAVTVRNRLGSSESEGVPLWYELKSEIGEIVVESTGQRTYYAAHTRANTKLDRTAILDALGIRAIEAEVSFNTDLGGAAEKKDSELFGLVNPLNVELLFAAAGRLAPAEEIVQVFDESLKLSSGYPNTLMTNIGIRTSAMEFRFREFFSLVVKHYPLSRIAKIATFDEIWLGIGGEHKKVGWKKFPPAFGPKIGILTGNSPESGLMLWSDFLDFYRGLFRKTTDVMLPEVMIQSSPSMGLTMELAEREPWIRKNILADIGKLLEGGCKIVTVACNTSIYFSNEIRALCEQSGASFISIAEACVPMIKKGVEDSSGSDDSSSKNGDIGLIGIGSVIDFNGGYSGYSSVLAGEDFQFAPCNGEELAWKMKDIGSDEKKITKALSDFRKLVREEFSDISVVVLALTEVSIVYRQHIAKMPSKQPDERVYIDPLHELSRELVRRYLEVGYRNSEVCQIPENYPVEQQLQDLVFSIS